MATYQKPIRRTSASPFKVNRWSPYEKIPKAKSLLNLSGHSHAHPNPPPPTFNLPVSSTTLGQDDISLARTKHVILGFNLWVNNRQLSPTSEQATEIFSLFPTCFAISHMAPYLVVHVQELPPKPWPVTVAGLPLYLTQSLDDHPMDWGARASGAILQIPADLGLWKTPTYETMKSIFEAFAELGAIVDQVEWYGIGFKILAAEQPFPNWRKRLPRAINRLMVGYCFGEESKTEKAVRKQQPMGNVKDDSCYDDLRPGLKLSSYDDSGVTYETTSGVCVESPDGTKYVTVAKHGFPGPLGTAVWHPHANGILLGHVAKQFGDSDIALCKLEAGLQYSQEPFCENAEGATITFGELGDLASTSVGDNVYMDTPFTGRVDGILINIRLLRLPVDSTNDKIDYAVSRFVYFGNGNDEVEEGCCGGVLWDDRNNVLGQFRFAGSNGLSYFPAFETIRRAGYKLSL